MPYEDDESSAADALDEGREEDASEDSFFVPADAVADHDCKPGDILKFEVLGKDADGDIEVRFSGYDPAKGGDFVSDMKRHMAPKSTG